MIDNFYLAKYQGRVPWDDQVRDGMVYLVFRDAYPVTKGHLLFVPKSTDIVSMSTTLYAAWVEGQDMIARGECDGFNIGMNVGEAAGQTIMYPHIHIIPRRSGDAEDPMGGIRGVIPGQSNYKKSGYKNPDK